jgi:hypothetical protein
MSSWNRRLPGFEFGLMRSQRCLAQPAREATPLGWFSGKRLPTSARSAVRDGKKNARAWRPDPRVANAPVQPAQGVELACPCIWPELASAWRGTSPHSVAYCSHRSKHVLLEPWIELHLESLTLADHEHAARRAPAAASLDCRELRAEFDQVGAGTFAVRGFCSIGIGTPAIRHTSAWLGDAPER